MRRFVILPLLLAFLVVFATGCGSIPSTTVVKMGAETATVVVLTEASENPVITQDINRAEAVEGLAIEIQLYLDPNQPLEPEILKRMILAAISSQFEDQRDRLLITILVNNLTTLVFAELDKQGLTWTSPEDEVLELVTAAASGVESGATLWLTIYAEEAPGE